MRVDWVRVGLDVALLALAFMSGVVLTANHLEGQFIEHGCAYYHPETGDFTWRDDDAQ